MPPTPELIHLTPGRRARDVTIRVRRVADAQCGLVRVDQLRACGVSNGAMSRWVRRGWLLRVHPGVYGLGHLAITPRGRLVAGLLYAGDGSALNHRSSAHHWGLIGQAPGAVHIASPGRRKSIPGIRIHRPRLIVPVLHRGLPVTSVAQTLIDIAPACTDRELRKALAEADFRKLIRVDEVHRLMGRGRPGSARLRNAIQRHMPELARTLSWLEDDLLLLCEREGIPLPKPNTRIGPYKPDALWPNAMLIVEVDGRDAHSSPDQIRRDEERAAYLRNLGYIILRYTWDEVQRSPTRVATEIRNALRDRTRRRDSAN